MMATSLLLMILVSLPTLEAPVHTDFSNKFLSAGMSLPLPPCLTSLITTCAHDVQCSTFLLTTWCEAIDDLPCRLEQSAHNGR